MKRSLIGIIITALVGISSFAILPTASVFAQTACDITDVQFDKHGFLPSLLRLSNDTVTKPPVKLTVTTKNCAGKQLRVYGQVRSSSELFTLDNVAVVAETYLQLLLTGPALIYGSVAEGQVEAFDITGVVADTNPFWVSYLANERPCTTASGADCIVSVEIFNLTDGGKKIYDSYEKNNHKGILSYECINDSDGSTEAGLFGNICSSHTQVSLSSTGQVGEFFGDRGEWDFVGRSSNFKRSTLGGDPIEDVTEFNTDSPCYDNDSNSPTYGGYKPNCNALLAPLPGLSLIDSSVTLGTYINTLVRLAIGLIVVFAVVMLVSYGFQYMTQGSITGKASAKEKIQNALIGVLIALGVFVILATINPNLLNLEPRIDGVDIEFGGDENSPSSLPANLPPGQKVGIGAANLDKSKITALGVYCPGTGGKAEIPKIIDSINKNRDKFAYNQSLRGQTCEGNKVCTDCSHLTTTIILGCAGITTIKGTTTKTILTSANSPYIESVKTFELKGSVLTVNGTVVNPGDIIGWSLSDNVVETRPGRKNPKPGHVVMYAGGGKTIEAMSTNDDIQYKNADLYWSTGPVGKSHRWIIRLP